MTRITKYFLTCILLTGSIIAYGQTADTVLTLQQCLDIAIKNNLQVRQSDRNAQSAGIDLRQSKENLLPNIGGNIGRTYSSGHNYSSVTGSYSNNSQIQDSYGVSGQVILFNGFYLLNAVKSASYTYQAGKMDFQAAKDVVTVNVITNYLSVLDNQEILKASRSQLAVQQETVNRLDILEQQGANKNASDITDAKGQLEGNKITVVNQENSLEAAKLSLFQLMNIPYKPDTHFEPLNAQDLTGDNGTDPESAYQVALQQFAAVKSATLKRESAEKFLASQRGNYWPQLTLGAGLNTVYNNKAQKTVDSTLVNIGYGEQFRNNNSTAISLGLTIPIFYNGVRRNNVARAKLNLLNARDVEDNAKIQLRQQVEQSYYNMQAAYRRYQATQQQVKVYTESFRIYKLRFETGVINSVDYIFAKNALDAATLNLISAKYDYFINSRILDYYQGKLTSL
ncbi:MAG: TolC family protein [Mucilaginibacter sp.]